MRKFNLMEDQLYRLRAFTYITLAERLAISRLQTSGCYIEVTMVEPFLPTIHRVVAIPIMNKETREEFVVNYHDFKALVKRVKHGLEDRYFLSKMRYLFLTSKPNKP